MVTYRCELCLGFPRGSACTLSYDIEVTNQPHRCPFEFGYGGLPESCWIRVEE